MAVLSDADRFAGWAEFMRSVSDRREALGSLTKQELRAAFDALDTFMDTNAGAINTAIPQPARGVLTTKQKAELLMLVIGRRYLVS